MVDSSIKVDTDTVENVDETENINVNDVVKIKGEVFRTWGQMKADGWTWFKIKDNKGKCYHVSGCISEPVTVGMVVECECTVEYSNQYGYSYKVSGEVNLDVATKDAIISYLSSSDFKGIGKKTAEQLYAAFGDQTMDMIENHMDIVCNTVSLTQKQKDSLTDVSKLGLVHQLRKQLPSLGGHSKKVVDYFVKQNGHASVESMVFVIKHNPVYLENVVPFEVIDEIYIKDMNTPLDDVTRMSFVISHHMKKVLKDFHNTYLSTAEEFDELANLVLNKRPMAQSVWDGVAKYPSYGQWLFNAMVSYYHDSDFIYIDKRANGDLHFYTKTMIKCKLDLVEQLITFQHIKSRRMPFYSGNKIKFQSWISNVHNVHLNKEQRDAVELAVTNNMSFISGGPGRGKTYTASALLQFWLFNYEHVIMLAPTGRAANKLKMETGWTNTSTIARFIYMNRNSDRDNDGYVIDTFGGKVSTGRRTLILIDEVSMLNFSEAVDLFRFIGDCTIVFLGDINQLAPIEAGCFLAEILKLNQLYPLPIAYLKKNMRTNVPALANNADRILDGTLSPKLHFDNDFTFDFTFYGNANGQKIGIQDADMLTCEKAFDYYMNYLQQGFTPSDIMLLCPVRNGCTGIDSLNLYFQNCLNPVTQKATMFADADGNICCSDKGYECDGFVLNGIKVRIMDRLMQTKNDNTREWVRYKDNDPDKEVIDHGTGLFNGDVGTIIRYYKSYSCSPSSQSVFAILLQMDDGRCFLIPNTLDMYENLCLGYAVTVHKAQGSEASCVIVVLPESSMSTRWMKTPFLTKNLLYTAVTRAKQSVSIIGSQNAFQLCLSSEQSFGAATVAEDVFNSTLFRRQISQKSNTITP